jgi:HAD superfamily hydrolase (TIGR01509 family)
MQIKGLLFDNDGVLTHTEHIFFEVNKNVLKSLNIPYTEQDFIEHTFDTGLGSSGWMTKSGYGESIIEDFIKLRDVAYRENIIKAETTELTAKPVLTTLKERYLLCIVTNTRRDMFQHTHENDEMYKLFDEVVCREDYAKAKPAPDAYLAALKNIKLEANETLVIEDSPRGIQAAQNAGIKVVAIRNPHFPNLDTTKADYHINSLTELDDLLKTL